MALPCPSDQRLHFPNSLFPLKKEKRNDATSNAMARRLGLHQVISALESGQDPQPFSKFTFFTLSPPTPLTLLNSSASILFAPDICANPTAR